MPTTQELLQIAMRFFDKEARPVSGGTWVMMRCPFAKWRHAAGVDHKPSFGMSISGGFNCFGCGIKGPLYQLPAYLARYTHRYDFRLEEAIKKLSFSKKTKDQKPPYVPLKTDFLEMMPYARPCLHLNKQDIKKWNIRENPQSKTLIFPIYDRAGNLAALKFRDVSYNATYLHDPSNFKAQGIWFGEHLYKNAKIVALTEGERDAILLSRYIPAIASLGTVSIDQLLALRDRHKGYILFFDNDEQGQRFIKKAKKYLRGFTTLFKVYNYIGCKDAAELVEKGLIIKALKSIKKL